MSQPTVALLALFVMVAVSGSAPADDCRLPKRVTVVPVFLVPRGQPQPSRLKVIQFGRHVQWAQQWYRQALQDRDTFSLARKTPAVVAGKGTLDEYRKLEGGTRAPQWFGELLDHLKLTRFNCAYVFVIVVINPRDRFPVEGGRPCNGGFNTGAGVVVASSYALDRLAFFQSTLRHELGHAFGLPHVDVYGYDMKTNPSIMSYNSSKRTDRFTESPTPGRLIPEDLRGLALNRRVFSRLTFDPTRDVPQGYRLARRVVWIPPMKIPGHPDFTVTASTESGQSNKSSVAHIVQGRIKPSAGPGVTMDAGSMWVSGDTDTGWVSAEVVFPVAVRIDRVSVHTQHSGRYHAAEAVRIEAETAGRLQDVAAKNSLSPDDEVRFPPAEARRWKFFFKAGKTRRVVVRGLRFFLSDEELFPPFVPPM